MCIIYGVKYIVRPVIIVCIYKQHKSTNLYEVLSCLYSKQKLNKFLAQQELKFLKKVYVPQLLYMDLFYSKLKSSTISQIPLILRTFSSSWKMKEKYWNAHTNIYFQVPLTYIFRK